MRLLAIAVSLPALARIAPAGSIQETGVTVVVTTATRRPQHIQNVPMAISAISAGASQKKGVFETFDLDNQMLNLQAPGSVGVCVDEVTQAGRIGS